MKLKYSLIICLFLFFDQAFSQVKRMTTSGIIEYEKTINMYAILKRSMLNSTLLQSAFEQYSQKYGQFKKVKSELKFSDNKTLFSPDTIGNPAAGFFEPPPVVGQNSIVFSDFLKHKRIAQKQTFDQTYLLSDTVNSIKWKITGETRDIAGYTCYRANGIILDSIYAVAFFTYEIPISGGPEYFSGLPGMILGVALPHENVSWFAVRVTDISVPSASVQGPTKGKIVNLKDFFVILQTLAKEKNAAVSEYYKGFLL